jgi:serine phosphatase RsbU (regulator of sigma subunit)
LPLGLVPDQKYELYQGRLARGEHLVLLSDGIPEARNSGGELYGFERLSSLVLLSAREIAQAAQSFGQEDDITVLTVGFERG